MLCEQNAHTNPEIQILVLQ